MKISSHVRKTRSRAQASRSLLTLTAALLSAGFLFSAHDAQAFSLKDALDAVQAQHLDRQTALKRLEATKERLTMTKASRLPRLSADARAGLSHQQGGGRSETNDSYSASLSASMMIWDFGRTGLKVEASESNVASSEADVKAINQNLAKIVYLAYIDALEAEAVLKQAQANRENAAAHLEETLTLISIGKSTKVDEARFRARLAESEASIIDAQGNVESARLYLSVSIGDTPATVGRIPDPLPDNFLQAELSQNQTVESPTLMALKAAAEAKSKSAEAADAWLRPSLDLSASTGINKTGEMDAMWNSQVALNLSFNFFDGFQSSASAKAEAAEALAARNEVDQSQREIDQQIESARLSLQTAIAQYETQEILVREAELLRNLTEERYKEGLENALSLNDAELSLQSANLSKIRSAFSKARAQVNLAAAMGVLPETL